MQNHGLYLSTWFPGLEPLKLKGNHRAAMFNLIPPDLGGYAKSWINQISKTFLCLKSLHLRKMIITNEDLSLLAHDRENILQVLKLEKCSGFLGSSQSHGPAGNFRDLFNL